MKEIIFFTSSTWPYCKPAKEYLRKKGYKFIEKNIQTDVNARQEMIKRGITGVPSFIVGNESFVGFDIDKLETLIDYKIINCPKCSQRMRIPKKKTKLRIKCKKCKNVFEI